MTNPLNRVGGKLGEVLDKCFSKFGSNSTLLPADYAERLIAAASSNTYVETVCRQADSLHRRISQTYEEVLEDALLEFSSKVVRKWRTPYVSLACDITGEDFYGEVAGFDIVPWTGEQGVTGKFKFMTLSVINPVKNQKIPLITVPVRLGQDVSNLLRRLLVRVKKKLKRKRILKVLLDRGFYSASVISLLNLTGLQYIILVPKKELFRCMLESVENWCVLEHELVLREDREQKKVFTNIVLVKDYRKFDWVLATNMHLTTGTDYVDAYVKRWNIETEFRVEDEARVKTKSTKLLVRYFYFIISLLLNLLWRTSKACLRMPFKAFALLLQQNPPSFLLEKYRAVRL